MEQKCVRGKTSKTCTTCISGVRKRRKREQQHNKVCGENAQAIHTREKANKTGDKTENTTQGQNKTKNMFQHRNRGTFLFYFIYIF